MPPPIDMSLLSWRQEYSPSHACGSYVSFLCNLEITIEAKSCGALRTSSRGLVSNNFFLIPEAIPSYREHVLTSMQDHIELGSGRCSPHTDLPIVQTFSLLPPIDQPHEAV
jgi:hypothetical protein